MLGDLAVLILITLLTAMLYFINPPGDVANLMRSILRMKWFFLSILLVYVFLDPIGGNILSQLIQGSKRVLTLLLIFLQVAWLIRTTPREKLIASLITLLSPLRIFGLSVNTLALRIELVLASIGTVQTQVADTVGTIEISKNSIKETSRHLSGLYQKITYSADQIPLEEVNITYQAPPSIKQWLLPVFLLIVFYLIHNYS